MKSRKSVYKTLLGRLKEPRHTIQVLLGPRQVGKTTLALSLEKALKVKVTYISADTVSLEDIHWLKANWETARAAKGLLIVDEVQKIPKWSEMIKKLWDEDTRNKINLKVILLGSSPWLMQKGLTESLTGRFEVLPVTHWDYLEMNTIFGLTLDEYIYYGGYPGAVTYIDSKDQSRWTNYINDALIETAISRDILLMTQVNKPALLRRLFHLGCLYSGQILSYQKMLGQLQDAGNTTTLAHYLDLLEGVGFIAGIPKFTMQSVRSKGSSPKFMVFNTALISAQSGLSFLEAKKDKEHLGRLTESAIGAHLLNKIRGTQIELTYWREGEKEVDFVLKLGKTVVAIEVKSSHKKGNLSGLKTFEEKFSPKRILLVGRNGIPIETFLKTPIMDWMK